MSRRSLNAALVPALALASCAAVTAVSRDTYQRERITRVVYPMPLEEVWPELQGMLRERGLHGMETPGELVYESEWSEVMGASRIAGTYIKYVAVGTRPESDPARCRVAVYKLTKSMRDTRVVGDGVIVSGGQQAGSELRRQGQAEDGDGASTRESPGGKSPSQLQYMGEQKEGQLRIISDLRESDRDEAMELQLLRRVAPEAAEQLDREIEAKFPAS